MTLVFFTYGQTIIVNPAGTHSVGINHGSTTTVINPDGTHSVGINHGRITTVINPDGTHSVGINHGLSNNKTYQNNSNSVELVVFDRQVYEDSLFAKKSTLNAEELIKFKILKQRDTLNKKEYKKLKNQILNDQSSIKLNMANQIFTLSQHYNLGQISYENYLLQKGEIIETAYNSQYK
jgi:uncharacterized membrane protein YfhO